MEIPTNKLKMELQKQNIKYINNSHNEGIKIFITENKYLSVVPDFIQPESFDFEIAYIHNKKFVTLYEDNEGNISLSRPNNKKSNNDYLYQDDVIRANLSDIFKLLELIRNY